MLAGETGDTLAANTSISSIGIRFEEAWKCSCLQHTNWQSDAALTIITCPALRNKGITWILK